MSPGEEPRFSLVVRTTARYVVRVMLVFGLYIILHGQITHGDGFAGGVILALGFILLFLVFGPEVAFRVLSRAVARRAAGAGMLMLLAIAFLGFTGGYFFFNFLGKGRPFQLWSAGIIPLCNIAIGTITTAALFGIYAALTLFRPETGRKR